MRFRITFKDLKERSDLDLLRILIVERKSTLNMCSRLYKRLSKIEQDIKNRMDKNEKNIGGEVENKIGLRELNKLLKEKKCT